MIRFSVWLASGYVHAFIYCFPAVIVTIPIRIHKTNARFAKGITFNATQSGPRPHCGCVYGSVLLILVRARRSINVDHWVCFYSSPPYRTRNERRLDAPYTTGLRRSRQKKSRPGLSGPSWSRLIIPPAVRRTGCYELRHWQASTGRRHEIWKTAGGPIGGSRVSLAGIQWTPVVG